MSLLAVQAPIVTPRVDWPVIAPVVVLFSTALLVLLVRAIVRWNP